MTQPLIIYHGECFDGFTAAWAARSHFMSKGVRPDFYGAVYPPGGQDTELPEVAGRDVFMVDFCVSREQLLRLHGQASSFQVIDHHKTHQEACEGLDFCEFDMDRSGAGMTWDFFNGRGGDGFTEDHRQSHRPWLVNYVQDRDLWKFELPESRIVNAYIMCQEMTWANWDWMFEMPCGGAVSQGKGAEAYLQRYVRDMKKLARRMSFPRLPMSEDGEEKSIAPHVDIPVVNAPYLGTSELVGALAEGVSFAVGWFQRADGFYQYSLRSRGEFDVGALAEKFGGGGHTQAAGFTVERRVHEAVG